MGRIIEMTGEQHGSTTRCLDPSGGIASLVMLIEVGDEDVRALARKRDRDGLADPAVGAGYHRLLAREAARTDIAGFSVVRAGFMSAVVPGGFCCLGRLRQGVSLVESERCSGSSSTNGYPGPGRGP